jgi:hypothetical protein
VHQRPARWHLEVVQNPQKARYKAYIQHSVGCDASCRGLRYCWRHTQRLEPQPDRWAAWSEQRALPCLARPMQQQGQRGLSEWHSTPWRQHVGGYSRGRPLAACLEVVRRSSSLLTRSDLDCQGTHPDRQESYADVMLTSQLHFRRRLRTQS